MRCDNTLKIHTMNEISVTEKSISSMCRLCISSDNTMINIFKFSSSMKNKIADVIMKCAPIQIIEHDELPNNICQLCYTYLEKMHQFQVQVVQSERKLRYYIKQLHASNKQPLADHSIPTPSEDLLTNISNVDITMKCESLEHDERFNTDVNWKEEKFVSCNSEQKLKEEPWCDNPLISTDSAFETVETVRNDDGIEISCEDRKSVVNEIDSTHASNKQTLVDHSIQTPSEDPLTHISNITMKCESLEHDERFDTDVNWKEEEFDSCNSGQIIKEESGCDNSLIPTDSDFETVETVGNEEGIKISCEDRKRVFNEIDGTINASISKIDIDHTPTFCFAGVMEYSDKREEDNKSALENNGGLKKIKKEIEMYKCNICDLSFTRLENFEVHKQLHACKKPCQCNICNKYFSNLRKLNAHKLTHSIDKPYKCEVCNKSFIKLCNLKSHNVTHTGEKPYVCNICYKRFSRFDMLSIHKRLHTGEKLFKCDICNKSFIKLSNLKSHNVTHTGEKPFQCDICNKCFPRADSLNSHKRAHTGVKPYKCDVCGKCFLHLCNLKTHVRTHTGDKPYQCDVCNKSFARSSGLKKHGLVHTGEKSHQCDICNKGFEQFYDLTTHKLTHTVEKRYQCDFCEKRFTRVNNLNVHKLTHTGEKPHQCDLCNKCFTHSNSLRIHKRTHTGEKPYQCDICEKKFPQSCHLKFHKLKHK